MRHRYDLERSIEYHTNVRILTEEIMASTGRGSWDSEILSIDHALITLSDPKTHDFGGGVLNFGYIYVAHVALEYETAIQAMDEILDEIDNSLSELQ